MHIILSNLKCFVFDLNCSITMKALKLVFGVHISTNYVIRINSRKVWGSINLNGFNFFIPDHSQISRKNSLNMEYTAKTK